MTKSWHRRNNCEFLFGNLKRLEDGIRVSMPVDENGLAGRECPNPNCLGYFKIKFGTGLKEDNLPCHCPYCGHIAGPDQFWTQEQIEYARSIMKNEVTKALQADTQKWDRELRQSTKNSFIKLSMDFKGHSQPIQYFREKQLETSIICENCTLEYAIYGVFAFCPDCGVHNSYQILGKNFELVEKEIMLAENTEDKELSQILIEDALENAISSFDGFGRSICNAFSKISTNPAQTQNVSFQNIKNARNRVIDLFGFDFADGLDLDKWNMTIRCFQKRHLLTHKIGVIDQEYLEKVKDPDAVLGRKILVRQDEVLEFLVLMRLIGSNITLHINSLVE